MNKQIKFGDAVSGTEITSDVKSEVLAFLQSIQNSEELSYNRRVKAARLFIAVRESILQPA